VNIKRGFNRLFLVLTLLWATFWIVVYPLHAQWDGQQKALEEYNKANKNCDVLVVESPDWAMTKDCYTRSLENYRNQLELYSFKNFWWYAAAFWKALVPITVLPPAILYGLVALGVWIRNGFSGRTSHSSSPPPSINGRS
jgi:hypothetical protein